ncbi:MAG: hypothetical protein Q8P34_08055, partial [Bacteroidota bacterium]|nr:hypothetical protein [Bacteroidota bacterium]
LNTQSKSGSERIMCLFKPDGNPFSTHQFKAGLQNSRALICDIIGCLRICDENGIPLFEKHKEYKNNAQLIHDFFNL